MTNNPHNEIKSPLAANIKYVMAGIFFGILLIKAEVVSWFRIQEMFRLQSFHMYGVIGTAVAVGALSVFIIKKFKIKTLSVVCAAGYGCHHHHHSISECHSRDLDLRILERPATALS